jgi:hypothetical protein
VRFAEFLQSDASQAVFETHGFRRVADKAGE